MTARRRLRRINALLLSAARHRARRTARRAIAEE
jgi:hypothetical protein